MTYKILVVDDEPMNLRLLERIFDRKYQVIRAFSGQEALELLTRHEVALIITDQRMPEMSGIEFLKLAAKMRPRVIRIIISGYAEVGVLTEAINSGVIYRFISKPWINEDLQQTVAKALEHYEVIKHQHDLVQTNERLTTQLASMHRIMGRLIADLADLDGTAAASSATGDLPDKGRGAASDLDGFDELRLSEYEVETEVSEAVS